MERPGYTPSDRPIQVRRPQSSVSEVDLGDQPAEIASYRNELSGRPIRQWAVAIFTRCQGDRCVVNRGEGLTTVDFSGGDAATAGAIGRSEGQREKRAVVDLLSFDSENELIADGVGKVPLLVSADATVVVHKEDDLVQKNTSVEELRKPTH
ncbi:hypothetical protein GW17_00012826 [Ensete ventricosum]|nr:hypothetical protein GW17_00012826 [Ensete ventricosum]